MKIIEYAEKIQKEAINIKHSIWVEANAGTGKTKILIDRVLCLLLNNIHPNKILCLTFTKAAAAEMKMRLLDKLSSWSIMPEQDLIIEIKALGFNNKYINRAKHLLSIVMQTNNQMNIQTMHSFCHDLLLKFPIESGISPYFNIIDESDKEQLLEQAWNEIIGNNYNDNDKNIIKPSILYLAALNSELELKQIIKNIINQKNKINLEQDFLNKIANILHLTPNQLNYQDYVRHICKPNAFIINNLQLIITLFKASNKKTLINYAQITENWLNHSINQRITNLQEYLSIYITKQGKLRKLERFIENDHITIEQNRIAIIYNKLLAIQIYESTSHLFIVAQKIMQQYTKIKNKICSIDFDDQILHVNNLLNDLTPAWILSKLDNQFEHILVDEAQDLNPQQWKIIDFFVTEYFSYPEKQATLFIVGDRKQSIYSFRGSSQYEFDKRFYIYKKLAQQYKFSFKKISMNVSFRSQNNILQLVDKVFTDARAKQGVLNTKDSLKHYSYTNDNNGEITIMPLCYHDYTQHNDYLDESAEYKIDNQELTAKNIAQHINNILQNDQIEPKDILVLVRNRSSIVDYLCKYLKNFSIPTCSIDNSNINKESVIQDIIVVIKTILLPEDDFSITCLLKGPFIGFNEDQIFDLAFKRGNKTIWQQIQKNKSDHLIYQQAYNFITTIIKQKHCNPYKFICYLLETMSGYDKLIYYFGEHIIDSINELLNLALYYEQNFCISLEGFVHWLNNNETSRSNARDLSRNAVQIMTVHGTKGLQAKIVFLADANRNNSIHNQDKKLILHNDVFFYLTNSTLINSIPEINYQQQENNRQENNRLLYVALTRAAQSLYIYGWNEKITANSWYDLINNNITNTNNTLPIITNNSNKITCKKTQAIDMPQWLHEAPSINNNNQYYYKNYTTIANTISLLNNKLLIKQQIGLLTHRLFELCYHVNSIDKIANDLQKEFLLLSPEIINNTVQKVKNIMLNEKFSFIFQHKIKKEVSLAAIINNKIVNYRIDHLVFHNNFIYIVDFKTSDNISDNKWQDYIQQMSNYWHIINKIHNDKTILCFIMFTMHNKLVPISKYEIKNIKL